MNVGRRLAPFATALVGTVLATIVSSGGWPLLARPGDVPDWPTAIATGPDGAVWLAMATDVGDDGGVARYDADLGFERAWGLAGSPSSVAVNPGGEVYIDEYPDQLASISRFTTDGRHIQSWVAGTSITALDCAPNGDVIMLGMTGDVAAAPQIVAYGATGALLDAWTAPDDSIAVATDTRGHVFVGQRTQSGGAIWHYSMNGTRMNNWNITSNPVGMDFDHDDMLFVAGQYGTPRGDVTVFERGGSFVRGWLVDARLEDLAVAPDGSVYVIVWVEAEQRFEVRKYDSGGNLLLTLVDFHPVQGEPRPPTATPGGRITPPTPWWPSPTFPPRTVTPTAATPTPTSPATATPTSPATATPTPIEASELFVPRASSGAGDVD